MLILAGSVRLPPENLEAARPAIAAMVAASRAEEGCIAYGFSEDVLEPGLLRVFEVFRDHALSRFMRRASIWRTGAPPAGPGHRRAADHAL